MKTHSELEAALKGLAAMLAPWLARVRNPAQFWPQFTVLAREVLDEAIPCDRPYVLARIDQMLAENHERLPARQWRCRIKTLPARSSSNPGSRAS